MNGTGKADANRASGDGQNVASMPLISLPKGGGAIRGMGEKFAANPVTGTGSMTVPIATSPGRSGFGPQLSLSYDSGAGNGPYGFGWSLSLPSITRKTDKGLPNYEDADESDVFILSGAEDLVPVLVPQADGQWLPDIVPPRNVNGVTYRIQRYRPRIEGLFARIERWTNTTDATDVFWRSISRDNIKTWYGRTAESRIADPIDPTRIFSWLTCQSYDDKGNAIVYEYQPEDSRRIFEDPQGQVVALARERNRNDATRSANRYLKRIKYGNRTPNRDLNTWQATNPTQLPDDTWMFEVIFDYGEGHYTESVSDAEGRVFAQTRIDPAPGSHWPVRQDPFSAYRAGFEVRTYRLCQRVLMFHHFPDELGTPHYLVRSTDFTYSPGSIASFITAVTQSGYVRQADGAYLKKSLPPLSFEYSEAVIHDEIETIDAESLQNLPTGVAGAYQWLDLDGEGLQGVLAEQDEGWYYKRNRSPISTIKDNGKEKVVARFDPVVQVATEPSTVAGTAVHQFLDLSGDGNLDVVRFEKSMSGFFERTEDQRWKSFTPFRSAPNVQWNDPNLKFVDLTGDGHADILITEGDVLTWYPSLAEEGFGEAAQVGLPSDEEKGPRLVFANAEQSIYLADLSGDGLTDLVRIRNGDVCYWPNLGYGRFGAKVTMDNAPWFDSPDQFDPRRIQLADIDGSGTTDIIYLERERVAVYRNACGNGWSRVEYITNVPAVDDVSSVAAVDLLGNGTACLVWSSPLPGDARSPMRYIDLMGGQKPHLLIRTVNNLGAETVVQYAPSTKFYLDDKQNGKPWITRLSFPVHCVERVETYDRISRNRFVTRYAYHHGYFDGVEREFRGFGMVEQLDTEEFAALSTSQEFPAGENIDETSHVPPLLTKTWFHTGVYLDLDRISNFFAGLLDDRDMGEYYREPDLTDIEARALLLEDTIVPEGLTIEEEREACRALKGAMLRQEVYGLDGSDRQDHPYTVLERNFSIRRVQAKAGNLHAVFFTHPREALSYHYERNPHDPRVGHTMTLEVGPFGDVMKSVAIGYGRRSPDLSLSPADQEKQAQRFVTYTENSFTNAVAPETGDTYLTPALAETRTFELTGFSPSGFAGRFQYSDFVQTTSGGVQLQFDAEVPYEQTPTDGRQRRLIGHVRTLYRRDDLSGALPLGVIESLALSFESYQLAFTPEHLDLIFGDRVADTMLSDEGRYVHFDGDDNWWIPSGHAFMSPNEDDIPAQELAFARQGFFLPLRFRDPFGQTATVEHDSHNLLMTRTTDPLENSVAAENNYRTLSPEMLIDPNGNRSAVAFDVLGLVAGTAVMAKESEIIGDSLERFRTQLTQDQIDAFFDDPRGPIATELLGNATSRIIYDETCFQRLKRPAFAATIVRKTHVSDLVNGAQTAVQVSLAYSDGFGRIIQNKVQAEPGPVEGDGDIVRPRWTASGWTIFNNKGNPVRQYEPFFSDRHAFEFGVRVGVSPTLFYDPAGRVIATLHPNHTWEKIIFDPWRQSGYDVNDTVLINPADDPNVGDHFRRLPESDYLPTWHTLRSDPALATEAITRWPSAQRRQDEASAAAKAAAHADTPSIVHFDALGRPFLSIADNGNGGQFETRTDQDIEGNPLRVIDARGNAVMAYQVAVNGQPPVLGYDVASRPLYENSMDTGEHRVLADIGGKPIRSWDSRGHAFRREYDELRRPQRSFVTGGDADDPDREIVFQRTIYGEGQGDAFNHRGRVFRVFDGAGVVTNDAYDFKGNLLRGSRQLLVNYRDAVDWSSTPALETEILATQRTYDALNHPLMMITPDNSVTLPAYNEANLLEQMAVRLRGADETTPFVVNIDYNARGQRQRITYATTDGTNCTTEYDYDPDTFRLTRLHTVRHRDNRNLQDLNYAYDPVGNITSIRDNAQQRAFFSNTLVEPHNAYVYDAIYRLIRAEGREHAAQNNIQRDVTEFNTIIGIPFPNSPEALQRYLEEYTYDGVGNILSMRHVGGAVQRWTRRYQYADNSNRLLATSVPGDEATQFSAPYTYDPHGNVTTMPHLPLMQWDFKDQLQASSRQVVGNSGAPETTYYVYDAAGGRARKVTERPAVRGATPTRRKERIYLGGFEVYREYDGHGDTVTLERETLHVIDGQQQIARIDTRTQGNDEEPRQSRRFQLSNHLGSVMLETDEQANVLSYEEYHPYGTSAYRAGHSVTEASLKRYRYTGKERDEETELYYYGARYYVCWLGRWISADRIGIGDGVNLYRYVRGNPVKLRDPSGNAPSPLESETTFEFEGKQVEIKLDERPKWKKEWKKGNDATMSEPVTADVDESPAVGEKGVKKSKAYRRATSPASREFKDSTTNRITKHTRKDTSYRAPSSKAISLKDDPSALFTKRFSEVKELNELFEQAKSKFKDRRDLKPTVLKDRINAEFRRLIKEGDTAAARSVRQALAKSGWDPYTLRPLVQSELSKALEKAGNVGAKGIRIGGRVLAVAGSFASGYMVGTGITKLAEGKTAEGAVDIGEGTAGLGLSIGVPIAIKAKVVTVETGIAAGGVGGLATLAAVGSVALAGEESRRAIAGEETLASEATAFYKEVQDEIVEAPPSVGGALTYVGAEIAGSATGFITSGQEDLWGLLR